MDGARGMEALGAAAQDRRIAGLEADAAGIRGHVRPRLVDDADDAERHAHALDGEAVRPRPFGQHGADGIGKGRDLLQPLGHRLDALVVELQPVEQRARHPPAPPPLGSRHVARHWRPGSPRSPVASPPPPPPAPCLHRGRASASSAAAARAASPMARISVCRSDLVAASAFMSASARDRRDGSSHRGHGSRAGLRFHRFCAA